MAQFTTNPVHRRNRRKLSRTSNATAANANVAVTSTGTTNATLTFDRPVVVTGTIGMTVATLTLVSQAVVSPTVVTQVWSGNVATHAYAVPAGDPNVATYQGGRINGKSGTFP